MITVESALLQGLYALQQIEKVTDGTAVQGLAYAAGLLVGNVLDCITDTGAESVEEEEN